MSSSNTRHGLGRVRGPMIACVVLFVLFWSSQAAALDAYKDRRGLFVGLGIGGGAGQVNTGKPNELTGFDDNYKLGLNVNGIIGGGWTRNVIFGSEFNWWIRNVQLGPHELEHQHMSFNAVTNIFLLGPLYVHAGGGLAYAVYDTFMDGDQITEYGEMGLSLKAGVGFEYFVNGTVAAGAQVGYTRHFYENAEFDTISGGITVRWY